MDLGATLKEFLEYIVCQLTQHSDEVTITHQEERGKHLFQIYLHSDDVGKMIGKNGYTISAIRSLLNMAAHKQGAKAVLKISSWEQARKETTMKPEIGRSSVKGP